jgi:hypothetical protein
MKSVYPQYDLGTATHYLYQDVGKVREGRFGREDLSVLLGFARISGMGQTIMSSMVHYGLLDNQDGYYVFTQSAKSLVNEQLGAPQRTLILHEAMLKPPVFRYIYDRRGLVSPEEIAGKFGIPLERVGKVLDNYRKSLKFVESSRIEQAPKTSSSQAVPMPSQTGDDNRNVVKVQLHDGKVIEVPKDLILEALQTRVNELDNIRKQLLSS